MGLVSAAPPSTIGITSPLLLPLAEPAARPAVITLMFASGFTAYQVSPLHLCQILTLGYFRTGLVSTPAQRGC